MVDRGCKKPGVNYPPNKAFVFSSPYLQGDEATRVLRECPTGAVMRNAPHVFEALFVYGFSEGAGLEIMNQSRWLQDAFKVISSEKARLHELEKIDKQTKRDANIGARVLKGR